MRSRRSPGETVTAGRCTVSCSAAGVTTPATRRTISSRWSSSGAIAPTSARSSALGFATSSRRSSTAMCRPIRSGRERLVASLKPVDVHLKEVLTAVAPLGSFNFNLGEAQGCVLAEDVFTTFPLPPFDSAATDGYAVRSDDVRAASPASPQGLPVVGDISPGSTAPYTVQPGLSVRIMAGAPMPPGADAVVPLEWTDRGMANVAINQPVSTGRFVRAEGSEAPSGTRLMAAGTHLGPTQIGMLAAVGRN